MLEKPPKVDIYSDDVINIIVDTDFQEELKKIQEEYLYWTKVKYRPIKKDKKNVWGAVKLHRSINSKSLIFGEHRFTYPTTDYIQRSMHFFDMNIGGTLGSNIGITDTDKTKYIITSIMEEAISSSQMEGANTTRKKAKEMIQQEKKPQSKSEQMIMNNYVTMKHIIHNKNEDLTIERLLEIHKLMCHKTMSDTDDEGAFRDGDDVFVEDTIKGENIYQPPTSYEINTLINDLCKFFNSDDDDFIHPIIKGCIIHFMIGWIHPFTDGNGRTARALFYWFMLKKGYWLTEYLSISLIIKDTKHQYEKAYLYTEYDDNDLGYFITYHMKTMVKAYDALKAYIGRKQKEVVQAAKFLKIDGVNERMAQILKIINDDNDRVLNSKEIEKRFNVSNYTARHDLKTLVEMGFLEVVKVNKVKQNFIKSKSFDKLLKQLNR